MASSPRLAASALWRASLRTSMTARPRAFPRQMQQLRMNSSSHPNPAGEKPVSPHVNFYKVFTRPVLKVLLMSVFVYQLAYWGWVKLANDETKQKMQDEIDQLEGQLKEVLEKKDQK